MSDHSDLRGAPWMPVEACLRTGERSPLSYFVKPLADYFERSRREGCRKLARLMHAVSGTRTGRVRVGHQVEHLFARAGEFPVVATRCDRTDEGIVAGIRLAAVVVFAA